jgi:hypothetical protein
VLQIRAVQGVGVEEDVTALSNDTPCFAALASAYR